jgi:hypothetical protein
MEAVVITAEEGAGALAAPGCAALREAYNSRDSRRSSREDEGEARHEAPPVKKNNNLSRRSDPGLIRSASQALLEHAEELGEEKQGEVGGQQGAP